MFFEQCKVRNDLLAANVKIFKVIYRSLACISVTFSLYEGEKVWLMTFISVNLVLSMSNQCFLFRAILEQCKFRKDLLAANVKIFISVWGGEKGWLMTFISVNLPLSVSDQCFLFLAIFEQCKVKKDLLAANVKIFKVTQHSLANSLSLSLFTREKKSLIDDLYLLSISPCQCLIWCFFSFALSLNYVKSRRICLQLMSRSLR